MVNTQGVWHHQDQGESTHTTTKDPWPGGVGLRKESSYEGSLRRAEVPLES